MMDFRDVSALLQVIHSAAGAGPKYTKFATAAAEELEAIWLEAHPEDAPRQMVEIPDPPTEVEEPEPNPERRI